MKVSFNGTQFIFFKDWSEQGKDSLNISGHVRFVLEGRFYKFCFIVSLNNPGLIVKEITNTKNT